MLINNFIDSPELLSKIDFKVTNCNLRNTDLFYSFLFSTNFMSYLPIIHKLKLLNKYNIDPFVSS